MYLFILILFFLSGFSSLIYQIVWLKKLHLIFGVTTPSIVAILIAFMSGISFGSFILGKYSSKFKRPFLVYGILEGLIGLYALSINYLFDLLDNLYIFFYNQFSSTPSTIDFFRFIFSFAILFFPTFLMGGTLPLLINGLEKKDISLGKKTGTLYGINTLGAFAGTFISTFYLIPNYGYKLTSNIAIFINIFIFFASIFIFNKKIIFEYKEDLIEIDFYKNILMIIFFMGFTSFGYEILWNRILILHTGSNVYAYGLVLCNILIGIALGSLFFPIISNKIKNQRKTLGWIELLLSIYSIFQIYLFLNFTDILTFFAKMPWKSASAQVFSSLFLGSLVLLFFPTFLMGLSFPLTVKMAATIKDSPGKIAGKVYGINTFGCISGTFISGIILIPWIGTSRSLFLMILINLFLSFILFNKIFEKSISFLFILFTFILFLFFPKSKLFLSAGVYKDETSKVFAFKEDITGTIVGIEKNDGLSLEINGINVAGTSPELYLIQKLQGHIPLLFSKKQEKVLHIGLGSGGTLYTVSKYPVKEIYIAEISPKIVEIASKYFKKVNDNVFNDKRIKINIADGRNFVLASKKRFDIILSDSIHPKYLGNGFLYTRDYFKLIYEKMDQEGIASMWLPLYSMTLKNYKEILKAFSDVFPYVTVWWFPEPINSFTIVVGSKAPFDFRNFLNKMDEKTISEDLNELKLYDKEKLISSIIINENTIGYFIGDAKPHIDDLPTVEYESNKVFTKTKTWLIILKELHKIAHSINLESNSLGLDEEKLKDYKEKILNEMEKQIEILSKAEAF